MAAYPVHALRSRGACDPYGVPWSIVAALAGMLGAAGAFFAWNHRRTERPYAAALRALAKADGAAPLIPVVTGSARGRGARASHLRRVRTASTVVLGLLAALFLIDPGHRLWTAALGAALILRIFYELSAIKYRRS